MSQLFLILISVAVMALLLVAGANYIQPSAKARIDAREKTTVALQALSSAYRAYKVSNRAAPPVVGWDTALIPGYTEKWSPDRFNAAGLSYGNNATYGNYFCYTSSAVKAAEYAGLLEVPAQFPTDSASSSQKIVVISYNACGKRTSDALGTAPTSFPATVYLTFWLDDNGASPGVPAACTASGAGDPSYNGPYTQIGTYNGYPEYQNSNGRVIFSNYGYWIMIPSHGDWFSYIYVTTPATPTCPSGATWTTDGGPAPAPTVN